MITLKRIYEPYVKNDGFRVLVDRLWPRGISKKQAHLDFWMKDIGPSNELRKWFGHEPKKWSEFKKRYQQELKEKKQLISELKKLAIDHKTLTLLYGAKDTEHNNAVVILEKIK